MPLDVQPATVLPEVPPYFATSGIGAALVSAAEAFADQTAVARGAEAWSYRRLWEESEAAGDWLAAEVVRGPVLYAPSNSPQALALLFGAIRAGRVPVLADPTWTAREREEVVRRCAIEAVLTEEGEAPLESCTTPAGEHRGFALGRVNPSPVEVDRAAPRPDTAFCRFTSGSTGFPRCLEFSDSAALAAARSWWQASRITTADRVLCLATLNNGLAFNTSLLSVFLAGGTLAFAPGLLVPSTLVRLFEREEPTVLVAFPFAYEQLLRGMGKGLRPARLRLAVSSAAPLKPEVAQRWREATGLPVCNYYGLVEVGPCTFNDASVPGSLGTPLPGVSFRVTDEDGGEVPAGTVGRIRVRTGALASGYLDRQGPAFAENLDPAGYFVTQDSGSLTPGGHLVLAGRIDSQINIEGRKVDPKEVEDLLRRLPAVTDVVVRGVASGGRTVIAVFVEAKALTAEEVTAVCVSHLAPYKRPQIVRVLPQLPRSAAGKVLAAQLSWTREPGMNR